MKQTLRYAAWAWQMSRRGLAALLSLATLAQAGLLVTAILLPQNVNLSYDALHQAAKLPWVFGVSYLGAALLTQRPLLARQGGSRPAFTILTFRMRRAQLLAGQALATALNLFLVMVWQLALLAALCLPAGIVIYLPFCFLAVAAGFMALLVLVLKDAFAQAVRMKDELDFTV